MAPKRRIARRHGAFVSHSGWSASNDPEWRYRKTLDKSARDEFDSCTEILRRVIVDNWVSRGEPS